MATSLLADLINFILHIDQSLSALIQTFGLWTYAILFAVIFAETGLVVAPFFPGDSLLFVAGTFAAQSSLDIMWLFIALSAAAIAGDTANYWLGHYLGPKVFTKQKSRFFKKEYLQRAREFYKKHGGKTIIIARFVPIIRTFAPFVAGIGEMSYRKFLTYNVVGGIAWVAIFLFAGYYFGTLQVVRDNLSVAIILIIVVSLIPVILEVVREKRKIKSKKKK
ncbi:MAG TPA: DedA family protein [archaeon]|nr:DedA family protein [archaeon]